MRKAPIAGGPSRAHPNHKVWMRNAPPGAKRSLSRSAAVPGEQPKWPWVKSPVTPSEHPNPQ